MKIWANTIVNNEENFIWFAIMSVVDYVDKVLVWDTGSTDKTVQIIKEIIKEKKDKIEFREVGPVDKFKFTKMRQAMLDESKCDWILILDGDEIWWENSIKQLVNLLNKQGNNSNAIVVPFYNAVGDIYHYQPKSLGKYKLLGNKGHLTIKAINKNIPGLHVANPYGQEGYYDVNNTLIQERNDLVFLDSSYLHVTHLKRSKKARAYEKFKFEIGKHFPKDFHYPEVFYKSYPNIVSNPWQRLSFLEFILSWVITPFKQVKRRFQ